MRLLKNIIPINEILDLQSDMVIFICKLSRTLKKLNLYTHYK